MILARSTLLACLTAMKSFWKAGSSAHCSSLRSSSRCLTQPSPILELISSERRGLEACSQRRGVMPLVLLLNLPGIEGVEVGEEMLLEQFGVKGRDAVDGVAADDGEIGHADHLHAAFLDERHDLLLVRVARISGLDRRRAGAC